MKNQVIKVLTMEHGEKVIAYWKSKGVYTGIKTGSHCESEKHPWIYYGVIGGRFDNYSYHDVKFSNAEIIELPEDEFDMTTNEGRLAYAKKHYPIGTVIKSIHHDKVYKLTSEPRNYMKTTIVADSHGVVPDIYHAGKWAEIVEKGKEEIVMETQKLSRQGLKEIHSVACSNWKAVLERYGANSPLEDYIELTQEQVDNMFKACTATQLPIVSKYLKQDDGSVDISKVTGGFSDENDYGFIGRRLSCAYRNKSFWLNDNYNWELKRDEDGVLCLIPTKKK
jgi:hypothetical protein